MVCIVDSSDVLVNVLVELLRQQGYQATGIVTARADTTQQVVSELERHHPAVCLYDVRAPDQATVAEVTLVREALASSRFVLTTTDRQGLRRLLGEQDPVRMLDKPFTAEDMLAAVREELSG